MNMHRVVGRIGLAAALAVSLVACSSDDDPVESGGEDTDETTTTAEETTTTESAEGETLEVTAIDYGYEGLDDTIAAGTKLSLTNSSEVEAHELLAFLIPEDETRSVEELLNLPEEELGAVFGGEPEPATVILAAPGQTDVPGAVVGDGTLTEPGRYGVACFLPVGGDPAVVLDPEAEGPPESDQPPHITQGMFAEVTVE